MQAKENGFLYSVARVLFAVFVALLVALPRSVVGAEARHHDTDARRVPFALAISGGISLGSYEAGLNWALLRYLKNLERERRPGALAYPELVAVAGSSAGSINAFLSALAWCIDDARTGDVYRDSLEDNVFREAWLGVGIDSLVPDDPAGYLADDGLLSRKGFEPIIQRIQRLLSADVYRPGCRMPIGITVFRVKPQKTPVAGLEPQNQRFTAPLELRSRPAGGGRHRAELVSTLPGPDDPYLGNHIVMPGRMSVDGTRHVPDTQAVIDALVTSSAFPFAFGRKRLDYCAPAEREAGAESARCPTGYHLVRADFVDGGLFDNIPLGLAKELAEPKPTAPRTRARWLETGRRFNYIFIDPDNRRSAHPAARPVSGPTVSAPDEGRPMTFGLRSQAQFLGGLLVSRGHFELYDVLRGGDWTAQTYIYAQRIAAVVKERFPAVMVYTPSAHLPPAHCPRLFREEIGARTLDTAVAQRALDCINAQLALIESVYSGTATGRYAGLRGEEVTQLRNTLIDWIAVLAAGLDHNQLALSVAGIKADKLADRRILMPTRFSPLTASMIANFGAFIDLPFREYDYYAGVYDAAHGVANYLCERREAYTRCLAEEVQNVFRDLRIGDSVAARTVFTRLAALEHPDYADAQSPWRWLHKPLQEPIHANMQAIFTALTAEGTVDSNGAYEPPPLGQFIRALLDRGFDANHSSTFMQRIVRLRNRDELSWYYPLSSRLSARALALEKSEREALGGGEIFGGTLALGALAAHTYIKEEERFTLNQSTAPEGHWMTWLPYEVAVDARNGGLDVSWEPSLALARRQLSLNAKITPFELNRFGGEEIWFSHLDAFLTFRRTGFFSSFGIGPTWTMTWKEWPGHERQTLGASVFFGFAQDKLRLTAGVMSFDKDDFRGDQYYINVGITDIPGFVYWSSSAY